MAKSVEVCVIINSADCTGDAHAWTPEDFDGLALMFKEAAAALRAGQHIRLNCDDYRGIADAEQFADTFCHISISQPYGGEPYVKEFMPPGSLDEKKMIRERNKRMKGRKI